MKPNITLWTPLEIDPKVPCTSMMLYDLQHTYWSEAGNPLTALFAMAPEPGVYLKIHFEHVDVVRVLDELLISTEETTEQQGLVPHHFAYTVKNSRFWNSQSEVYRDIRPEAVHYRYITGSACLDVLTSFKPSVSIVAADQKAQILTLANPMANCP